MAANARTGLRPGFKAYNEAARILDSKTMEERVLSQIAPKLVDHERRNDGSYNAFKAAAEALELTRAILVPGTYSEAEWNALDSDLHDLLVGTLV